MLNMGPKRENILPGGPGFTNRLQGPLGASAVNTFDNLSQYLPTPGRTTAIGTGTALGVAAALALFMDSGWSGVLVPVAIGYGIGSGVSL